MRVNIYSEELTHDAHVIPKEIDGVKYIGFRLFMHLPVTMFKPVNNTLETEQVRGPFRHKPGDDDSSAVTFWVEESRLDYLLTIFQSLASLISQYKNLKEQL